jgi:hypothetical protein
MVRAMSDEIYGGNYTPITKKQLDEMYECGEIDHNDYIKLMKHSGLWRRVLPKINGDEKGKDNEID